MSPLLLAALAAILALQSNVNITRLDAPVKMNERIVLGAVVTDLRYGVTYCTTTREPGKAPTYHVDRIEAVGGGEWLEHEVLHSVSCVHSGATGRLLPFPPKTDDPEHEFVYWCLANQPECIAIIESVGAR